jgi:hypothetical protein
MAGTLRPHFTAEDLLRTRVLTEPDPIGELVLSLCHLVPTGEPDRHAAWRRDVVAEERALYDLSQVIGRASARILVALKAPGRTGSAPLRHPKG